MFNPLEIRKKYIDVLFVSRLTNIILSAKMLLRPPNEVSTITQLLLNRYLPVQKTILISFCSFEDDKHRGRKQQGTKENKNLVYSKSKKINFKGYQYQQANMNFKIVNH